MANVGISPTPLVKSVFQKTVVVISSGFHLSHSVANEFGPEPNRGFEERVFLAILAVVPKDGRTSILFILKNGAMYPPRLVPAKTKATEIIKTVSGYRGITRSFPFHDIPLVSPLWRLNTLYNIKRNEEMARTIQTKLKFTRTRKKREKIRAMERRIFINLLKLSMW